MCLAVICEILCRGKGANSLVSTVSFFEFLKLLMYDTSTIFKRNLKVRSLSAFSSCLNLIQLIKKEEKLEKAVESLNIFPSSKIKVHLPPTEIWRKKQKKKKQKKKLINENKIL